MYTPNGYYAQQPQYIQRPQYYYPWGGWGGGGCMMGYGGFLQPNYLFRSMFGGSYNGNGGVGFDPRMFILPNAIKGYGDSTLQFPGLTFDQGKTLKQRLAARTDTFKERQSLYQSMPGNANTSEDARAATESIYMSSDGTMAYERPPSIAPGSPPAQFAPSPIKEESSAASLLMAALFGSKPAAPAAAASARPATKSASPFPQKSTSVPPKKAGSLQPSQPKSLDTSALSSSPAQAPSLPLPSASGPASALANQHSEPLASTEAPVPISVSSTMPSRPSGQQAQNVLCGVGLLFSREQVPGGGMGWVVRKVVEGSPAGKAGTIKVGDQLTQVDGQQVASIESMFEVSKVLLGLEDSKTQLTFNRAGGGKAYKARLTRSSTFTGGEGGTMEPVSSANEPGGGMEV